MFAKRLIRWVLLLIVAADAGLAGIAAVGPDKAAGKLAPTPPTREEIARARHDGSYFVITHGGDLDDNVSRFPITSNDTVLDSLSQVNCIGYKMRIWIVRPATTDAEEETILKVDWEGITQGGSTATNYQLLPGDQVFVTERFFDLLVSKVARAINPLCLSGGALNQTDGRAYLADE
jgi:hypothetical protein